MTTPEVITDRNGSVGSRSWEAAMLRAHRIVKGYGRRAQVYGKQSPDGRWYYWTCFAPRDRQVSR